MKIKVFLSLLLTLLFLFPIKIFAFSLKEDYLISENDKYLIAQAIEASTNDASLSLCICLASVIINRYRSPIYPDSILKIIEEASFLAPDFSVTPSVRSTYAVKIALLGSSPILGATEAKRVDSYENPPAAEYIVIDGICFYS